MSITVCVVVGSGDVRILDLQIAVHIAAHKDGTAISDSGFKGAAADLDAIIGGDRTSIKCPAGHLDGGVLDEQTALVDVNSIASRNSDLQAAVAGQGQKAARLLIQNTGLFAGVDAVFTYQFDGKIFHRIPDGGIVVVVDRDIRQSQGLGVGVICGSALAARHRARGTAQPLAADTHLLVVSRKSGCGKEHQHHGS